MQVNEMIEPQLIELVPRNESHSWVFVVGLIACLLLISLARVRQRDVFLVLAKGSFSFRSMNDQYDDGVREHPFAMILLTTQYFLICGLCIYWGNQAFFEEGSKINLLILAVPMIWMIYQLFVIVVFGNLFGRRLIVQEIVQLSLNLVQTTGIILLMFFLFAYFQPEYFEWYKTLIISIFLFFAFARIVRGFYHSMQQGIPWYYIILYFWTLEILPILIVARLVLNGGLENLVV